MDRPGRCAGTLFYVSEFITQMKRELKAKGAYEFYDREKENHTT